MQTRTDTILQGARGNVTKVGVSNVRANVIRDIRGPRTVARGQGSAIHQHYSVKTKSQINVRYYVKPFTNCSNQTQNSFSRNIQST